MSTRRRPAAAVSLGVIALVCALGASAAKAPRLAGKFQTDLRVTFVKSLVGVAAGSHAVRTWTFVPKCASGSCMTLLDRPSIAPRSTTVYIYTLKPISAKQYKGSIKPVVVPCLNPNGSVRVSNGLVNSQTIVLNVTKASGGKVTAFTGTQHTIGIANAAGKAQGCVNGEQRATFTGHT
jgi:hypothetical protein